MADLKELYTNFRDKAMSGVNAWTNAASSPLQTLGGVASEVGHIAKGIGGLAMDIPQAFMSPGVKLPWSSGPIVPEGDPDPIITGGTAGAEWKQRLAMLLNVPGMGIPNQLAQNYRNTGTVDDMVIDTVKQVLPVHEFNALAKGESITNPGQPLEPGEYGEVALRGALKFIPAFKGAKGVMNWAERGTMRTPLSRTARSMTEMEAGQAEAMAATGESGAAAIIKYNKLREEYNNYPKDALPEAKLELANQLGDAAAEAMTAQGFTPSVTREFISKVPPDVLASHLMEKILEAKTTNSKLDRISKQAIDLLGSNSVAQEGVVEMMRKYDLTPTETAAMLPTILDGLMQGATNAGKTLKIYSDLEQVAYAKMFKNNPELRDHLQAINKAMGYENSPQTIWQKVNNNYKNIEQFWRGMVVSSPTTAARNFTGGALNFASTLFDDLMVGNESYLAGKLPGSPRVTYGEAMMPFMNKLTTMQEVAFGGAKSMRQWWEYMQGEGKDAKFFTNTAKSIDAFETEYPGDMRKVFSGPVQDLAVVNFTESGLKSALPKIKKAWGEVETLGDAAKFSSSLLNTMNTMQEMFWRKFYFTSKLNENVRRFGFKTPEEFFNTLKEEKVDAPHYFGEVHTPESLAALETGGTVAQRIANRRIDRIDAYEAQKGGTLHSTEKNIANTQHAKTAKDLTEEFAKVKSKLTGGATWKDVAPTISPELAEVLGGKIDKRSTAITSAADYALKQTFAWTPPKGNFGYSVMKLYEEFPMLYSLATPFPRFMINSSNWILDHQPAQLMNIASPKFLKTLAKAAADPTSIVDPAMMEQFSRAHTGAALWSAAHYLTSHPEHRGPKYYQLNVGKDDDGNDIFADMRPYNPFVQFLFLEHTMGAMMRGETPNLTAAELTDAVTGLRRLGEVPIFAFPDLIRQIDSSNPDAFFNSLKPLVGQWASGFFTPFRMLSDTAGALGVEGANDHKDMAGNELFGPTLGNIPIVREALPDRTDPFTGNPGRTEHPAVRMAGPNLHHATKLEQQISMTGMPLNDLLGNYADPEADRLVRKYIGEMLNTRGPDGHSLANQLGQAIQQVTADKPIEMKKTLIRELYGQIREAAKAKAQQENPYAFIEHEIRQRPEAERTILREGLKQLRSKKVELMQR